MCVLVCMVVCVRLGGGVCVLVCVQEVGGRRGSVHWCVCVCVRVCVVCVYVCVPHICLCMMGTCLRVTVSLRMYLMYVFMLIHVSAALRGQVSI